MKNTIDYCNAGVDIEAGDALVEWLAEAEAESQKQKRDPRLIGGIGGFASLFKVDFSKYKNPLLVSCTDGVGTKVKLAVEANCYDFIGQDLVAMCVNDLICTGGEPLFFLDYYATGKLDLAKAKVFLKSVKDACQKSNLVLVGGETAEMPGVYNQGDFDCAGFAVGVVEQESTWGPVKVQDGDILVAIESSGFHSNGYSLLRKLFGTSENDWNHYLLRPTHLYVELVNNIKGIGLDIHAAAHITGGGILNIDRVLPEHLTWQKKSWEIPEPFLEVQRRSNISDDKLMTTFNCGIGFVLVLPKTHESMLHGQAEQLGFKSFKIGEVVKKVAISPNPSGGQVEP